MRAHIIRHSQHLTGAKVAKDRCKCYAPPLSPRGYETVALDLFLLGLGGWWGGAYPWPFRLRNLSPCFFSSFIIVVVVVADADLFPVPGPCHRRSLVAILRETKGS